MTKRVYLQSAAAAACLALAACSGDDKDFDATGTFEATEITVSAEQNGRLLRLDVAEGERVDMSKEVGLIDTTQLYLKAVQLEAAKSALAEQRPDEVRQTEAIRRQLEKARQEVARFSGLVKSGAANRKALEDAESQVKVLEGQLAAAQSSLRNSSGSLSAQMSATEAQRQQALDGLRKCRISSPIAGVVLDKYMESGEFAAVGKPLFKVADMDNVFLRAYLTSAQLAKAKLGQEVTVYADYGGERKEYRGRMTWIADKSEFTPKTILTDDERADLVYAVKIAVKNDGGIKIGMYGEVRLSEK